MNNNHYLVIMAGGTCNRFWPICRDSLPKQFMDITGHGQTFLRMTYERCLGLVPTENIIIITLSKYKDIVKSQIPEIDDSNLLLEPYSRGTAPCITYATYSILRRNPDATIAVTPSDHIIPDSEKFRSTISKAMDYAENHQVLTTLGSRPTRPETSFGYIQIMGGKSAYSDDKPVQVKTFTEKPDKSLAEIFCKSGEFFWNTGIFVWKASVIISELNRYSPEITGLFKDWENIIGTEGEQPFINKVYTDCSKISIDYAVMEKTSVAWLYPATFEWRDIDNWEDLYAVVPKVEDSTNVCNSREPYIEDASGNIIMTSKGGKLIAVKGLDDFIIVDSDDVLLICPKDEDKYKDFIAKLAMPGFDKYK